MRSSNGHLAHGTSGNPQGTLEQDTLTAIVAENEHGLEQWISSQMIDESLVTQLQIRGVKFNRKEMLFITRDRSGQIVWLEKGNPGAGMDHIKSRGHDEQFAKAFGISKTAVESYLRTIVSEGTIIDNRLKPIGNHMGYERVYYYEGKYCVVTGIGTNGFIVSAYPRKYGKES